jgi:hypothetical protein
VPNKVPTASVCPAAYWRSSETRAKWVTSGPERPGGAGPSRRSTGAANAKGLREHPNHHQPRLPAAPARARARVPLTQIGRAMIPAVTRVAPTPDTMAWPRGARRRASNPAAAATSSPCRSAEVPPSDGRVAHSVGRPRGAGGGVEGHLRALLANRWVFERMRRICVSRRSSSARMVRPRVVAAAVDTHLPTCCQVLLRPQDAGWRLMEPVSRDAWRPSGGKHA